jgi:hypothetical protein
LSVLLSKLRHGLGAGRLRGRTQLELLLPAATFVDVEAALEGAHRAESLIAEGRWAQAWGPAGIAYHVASRPFLVGLEAPWMTYPHTQVILTAIANLQVRWRRRSRLDLDPAGLVLAGDLPDQLRVHGSQVRLDGVQDLVVGGPAGDVAAFAVDDPCHVTSTP